MCREIQIQLTFLVSDDVKPLFQGLLCNRKKTHIMISLFLRQAVIYWEIKWRDNNTGDWCGCHLSWLGQRYWYVEGCVCVCVCVCLCGTCWWFILSSHLWWYIFLHPVGELFELNCWRLWQLSDYDNSPLTIIWHFIAIRLCNRIKYLKRSLLNR